ncbi:MAG: hypothetical protein JWO38_5538 [Gemmataceae bacterium]|nr:hypothetical protein [Gemmataceae bacterium]
MNEPILFALEPEVGRQPVRGVSLQLVTHRLDQFPPEVPEPRGEPLFQVGERGREDPLGEEGEGLLLQEAAVPFELVVDLPAEVGSPRVDNTRARWVV